MLHVVPLQLLPYHSACACARGTERCGQAPYQLFPLAMPSRRGSAPPA